MIQKSVEKSWNGRLQYVHKLLCFVTVTVAKWLFFLFLWQFKSACIGLIEIMPWVWVLWITLLNWTIVGVAEANTSHLVYEVASSNLGNYQCVFFNAYVLSKFTLDITDIGEGKNREETWAYQYKSEIANPSWARVVINAHAFSVREETLAQQWDSNRLVLIEQLSSSSI